MTPPAVLHHVDLVPGKLRARISLCEINSGGGPVPCWVYASEGLAAYHQRELAFALRRLPHENPKTPPRDMLDFFVSVLGFAERGQLVGVGGITGFGPSGFMGDPNFRGIGYLRNHRELGLPVPADTLAAIALVGHEFDVAQQAGVGRVAARLGQAARQYPFPAWAERGRAPVITPNWSEATLLRNVPMLHAEGSTAVLDGQRVTLHLSPARASAIRDTLANAPPDAAFGILCELDPNADACLVWEPGQQRAEAISPPHSQGTRLSGCFVVFAGQQTIDEARIVEDGFAVLSTDASYAGLRRALSTGTPWTQSATSEGFHFAIDWDAHVPTTTAPARTAGNLIVRIDGSIDDIAARMPSGALASYLEALEHAIQAVATANPQEAGQDLWFELEVWPQSRTRLHVASRPGMNETILHHFYAALGNVPVPPLEGSPFRARGACALWGGTGAPLDPG